MTDPRTPTNRLASASLGAVSVSDEECDLCGRPATHDGVLCSGCFDERWEFDTDAEADAHAREKLAALRGGACITCGSQIEAARFQLGGTTCSECKQQPHRQVA